MAMIKGTLDNGFEFEIEEDLGNDWEILEDIAVVDTNPLKMVSVMKRILGDEQYARLKEHIRNENGKVLATDMSDAFVEICNKSANLKN